MKNVEIYGRPACIFCKRAVALCESNSIKYTYYQLGEDYEMEDLWEKVKFRTYPQIFTNFLKNRMFSAFTNVSVVSYQAIYNI